MSPLFICFFDAAFITGTDIWQSGGAAVRMKENFSVAMATAAGEVKGIKDKTSRKFTDVLACEANRGRTVSALFITFEFSLRIL